MNKALNVLLNCEYEKKIISEGDNFPRVNINKYNLKEVCVLLHNDIFIEEIKNYFRWSDKDINMRLSLLLQEELIKKEKNKFILNCMIISIEESKKLIEESEKLVDIAVELIKSKLEDIKSCTYKLKCFNNFKFEDISLFILSDVILDCIQIDNVEELFLKSKRTKRNNMNYYFSLQEKGKNSIKEALNIYGNIFKYYGDIAFGLYGNERMNSINFYTIEEKKIKEYFGESYFCNDNETKEFLLKEFLKIAKDRGYNCNSEIINGFNRLNLLKDKDIVIPILTKKEFFMLNNIADIIRDEYIKIFENNKKILYESYKESNYFYEISFEEYFIWWYHIYYSMVTDKLIEKEIIKKSSIKNFSYIVI
ncbi:hypothetical protein [Hathewaya limosa]|uniref:Uncharacterized protein n=1 Tax=Hathewaya limosa TaxID=1536 RepID=A0ABU0JUU9_HATLI|nr:hypothetical protein [Hathewaya limosa]MDQ0479888.1 hypothetical protein [Hathewaya limosa]